MNKKLDFRTCFIKLNSSRLLIFGLAIFLSISISRVSHAQDGIVCETLDNFQNTTLEPLGLLIIDFSDPDAVNVLDDGSPGVLGGVRNITYGPMIFNMGFFAQSTLRIGQFEEGSLSNSSSPESMASFSILYNANGEGLNLELSNTAFINLTVFFNDEPNTTATFVITDSSNNSAEYTVDDLPSDIGGDTLPAEVDFILSEFDGIDSVDLSDIYSIEFKSTQKLFGSDILFTPIQICGPPIRNIPTISEWGLIAMAGVLGIVGFIVIIRRKVTA